MALALAVYFFSPIVLLLFFIFFFFQAEDGIRDTSVTGVQTCALPIKSSSPASGSRPNCSSSAGGTRCCGRPSCGWTTQSPAQRGPDSRPYIDVSCRICWSESEGGQHAVPMDDGAGA